MICNVPLMFWGVFNVIVLFLYIYIYMTVLQLYSNSALRMKTKPRSETSGHTAEMITRLVALKRWEFCLKMCSIVMKTMFQCKITTEKEVRIHSFDFGVKRQRGCWTVCDSDWGTRADMSDKPHIIHLQQSHICSKTTTRHTHIHNR